ncbi:acyl-CoA thioesterase [Kangiella sp. HZ709]|uniref:acyl-CoA thioesterase n=1 Tax=Kangiella sp. HZ709 TaxID=2666328 RepID=UPI0012AF8C96|nr:acyl-CoA thioesterase [Kangiella sp. HZ709]MRX27841.1 acyl-CoA thioesterase [Kangiella sp. HZ709]
MSDKANIKISKKAEAIETWNFVFPNQSNPYGNMFGGELLAIMDTTAALAAIRFSGKTVSTASSERVIFKRPIFVGDRIKTVAKVVLVGRTSMMVRTDVFVDKGESGDDGSKDILSTTAHFTLVAFDENRVPTEVPDLILETETEKKHSELAQQIKDHVKRREERIKHVVEKWS